MIRTLSSIILEIEKQTTDEAQADVMRKNSSAALKTIIGYALDPGVKWMIPPGAPPYKQLHEAADQEGKLYSECVRMFIYFVDSPENRNITQIKREQLFIQVLESVDRDDAKLILRVKDKALNISRKAVMLAFPNTTKDWPE